MHSSLASSSVHRPYPYESAGAGACACTSKLIYNWGSLLASRPMVALGLTFRALEHKRELTHTSSATPTIPPKRLSLLLHVSLFSHAPPPRVAAAYNTPSLILRPRTATLRPPRFHHVGALLVFTSASQRPFLLFTIFDAYWFSCSYLARQRQLIRVPACAASLSWP